MTYRSLALLLGVAAVAACASSSKITIAQRLEDFGFAPDRSECIANELDDRLGDDELNQFARFLTEQERAETMLDRVVALRQIDDPKIGRAIAGSLFSCGIV